MDKDIAIMLSELIVNECFKGMAYKKAFLKVVQAYQQGRVRSSEYF